MRETLGEEAMQQVVDKHEKHLSSRYSGELKGINNLESKIVRLADIRRLEGYMAEYENDEKGFLFIIYQLLKHGPAKAI